MVDVSSKPIQQRTARAQGEIRMASETLKLIRGDEIAKGNVLATARIAGIQAAKRTGELIPLCHPLPISHCEVEFEFPKAGNAIVITATAKVTAQTGVEMEALTAVNLSIPITNGRLALGTWQGIYLWEHRHAGHHRKVTVHVIGE